MKIIFAKEISFCFGVKRALKIVEDNLSKFKKPIKMYGPLVHNEEVSKFLEKMDIKIIDDIKKTKKGTLIIAAHGISPKIKKNLQKRIGLNLIDTTCPLVAQAQKKAKSLKEEGREVLIFGDINHKEVIGLKGATEEKAIIFSSKKELSKLKFKKNKEYGLLAQTTRNFEQFKEIEKIAKRKFSKIKIFNTICQTSLKRQAEIRKLAKKVDLVLVIGSTISANTKQLYQISLKINPKTFLVSTEKDLKKEWFRDIKNIGISTGASTPDWVINKVVKKNKRYQFRARRPGIKRI